MAVLGTVIWLIERPDKGAPHTHTLGPWPSSDTPMPTSGEMTALGSSPPRLGLTTVQFYSVIIASAVALVVLLVLISRRYRQVRLMLFTSGIKDMILMMGSTALFLLVLGYSIKMPMVYDMGWGIISFIVLFGAVAGYIDEKKKKINEGAVEMLKDFKRYLDEERNPDIKKQMKNLRKRARKDMAEALKLQQFIEQRRTTDIAYLDKQSAITNIIQDMKNMFQPVDPNRFLDPDFKEPLPWGKTDHSESLHKAVKIF